MYPSGHSITGEWQDEEYSWGKSELECRSSGLLLSLEKCLFFLVRGGKIKGEISVGSQIYFFWVAVGDLKVWGSDLDRGSGDDVKFWDADWRKIVRSCRKIIQEGSSRFDWSLTREIFSPNKFFGRELFRSGIWIFFLRRIFCVRSWILDPGSELSDSWEKVGKSAFFGFTYHGTSFRWISRFRILQRDSSTEILGKWGKVRKKWKKVHFFGPPGGSRSGEKVSEKCTFPGVRSGTSFIFLCKFWHTPSLEPVDDPGIPNNSQPKNTFIRRAPRGDQLISWPSGGENFHFFSFFSYFSYFSLEFLRIPRDS